MISIFLWITGSLIFSALGSLHLYYTFYTNKFSPREKAVAPAMEATSPILTSGTTMWKAWVGFNASHSIGAIYLGITNIFLALQFSEMIFTSYFYFAFTILVIAFYVWLAKNYWFKIPLIGISVTLCCYIFSFLLSIF